MIVPRSHSSRRRSVLLPWLTLVVSLPLVPLIALEVEPTEVRLRGSDGRAQVVVTGRDARGEMRDLTHDPSIAFESLEPAIATVDGDGLIRLIGEGRTRIEVRSGILS